MSKVNSAIAGAGAGFSAGGPWGAAAGGIAGYLLGSDDKSSSYYEQMLKDAQGIPLPILKETNPELYQQLVSLNPELESAINLGPSAMEGIALDPKYQQAQMNALDKLMDISNNDGRDARFQADASRLQNDINQNLQGNTQAIQQNMATRGMSGGMGELVSKQIASQQGANRQAQLELDLNAQAQQRALTALMNQNQVASNMQGNDFNRQSQVAQAQDAISKFNAQNRQQVQSNNVANKNNAAQWNAQMQQNTANKNVDIRNNQQNQYNQQQQQQFENELRKRGMINTGYQNMANNSYQQSRDQDQFLGGVFSNIAKYGANKKDEE